MSDLPPILDADTVLFVDDEPQSRKWFERMFSDEFDIVTAAGGEEALALLASEKSRIALLVTDYRMPGMNGMELLLAAQRDHRQVVRLMITAYAEKDVAIAAINQGQVFRILEKPLDGELTRQVLRDALTRQRGQALGQALHEGRMLAVRETLGFLAHELNTPLTTVRGYMGALRDRYDAEGSAAGSVRFNEHRAGEVLQALEAAERNALYCQSLVSTFVRSAREAYPGAIAPSVTATSLINLLLDEFPFEGNDRAAVQSRLEEDFSVPGQRDLLLLVLSTLTKNALIALQDTPAKKLFIETAHAASEGRGPRPLIRFTDNGPGIAPEVLAKLTREPVTTRASSGGNGMGLLFCRRVIQSVGGSIEIASAVGEGTAVTLLFPPQQAAPRSTAAA